MASSLPPTAPKMHAARSVKDLRANFEKNSASGGANGTRAPLKTPEQFMLEKKQLAEREYANFLLARKKAAAHNLAIRQVEITQQRRASVVTAPAAAAPVQEEQVVRRAARRVSVSLAEAPLPVPPPVSNPASAAMARLSLSNTGTAGGASIEQRRGTSLLLATMCEELEVEMRHEELQAIREEEAARQRLESAVELQAKESATEALQAAQEEKQRAVEIQELARQEAEAARAELEAVAAVPAPAPVAPAATTDSKDRQVLLAFLQENHPNKVGEVDALLLQFSGNLEVLFEELGKAQDFKEDEDTSGGATLAQEDAKQPVRAPGTNKQFLLPHVDLRSVVASFYTVYAKSKLAEIDGILAHFANREADLFRTLEVKYDVTFSPDGTCVPNASEFYDHHQQRAGGGSSSVSKFAVDVQSRQLKDRLSKQGQSQETVNAVLASGSGMM